MMITEKEVLYYYDGQHLSWIAKVDDGFLYYVHATDWKENEKYEEYLMSETTLEEIKKFKNNEIDIYDMLNKPICFILREYWGDLPKIETEEVNFKDYDKEKLPKKGVFLRPKNGEKYQNSY